MYPTKPKVQVFMYPSSFIHQLLRSVSMKRGLLVAFLFFARRYTQGRPQLQGAKDVIFYFIRGLKMAFALGKMAFFWNLTPHETDACATYACHGRKNLLPAQSSR